MRSVELRRFAFTLTELLLVIGIIGVLAALTLAAVQRLRAAAERTQCGNNLHQIAIATHRYHDSFHTFPAGMRYQGGKDPFLFMSWLTQILPFVEQQPLWLTTEAAYAKSPFPFKNPPHVGLATLMPIFVCPSDWRVDQTHFAPRDKVIVALTSYLGVEGQDLFSADGVLFADSRIPLIGITDGTSQTLLAGERPASTDYQFGWWYAGTGQIFSGSADSVLGVQEMNEVPALVDCAPGPYGFAPGTITNQCDMFHFWSLHPGGANFIFADGSVHFLTYGAASIMPALASRKGGEVVDDIGQW